MLETFRWLLPHAGKLRTAECPFAPTTNTGNFWRCLMLGAAAGSCCMLASYCWILVDIGGLLLDTGGLVLDADWLLLDIGGLPLDAGWLLPDAGGLLDNDPRRMLSGVSPGRAILSLPALLS